MYQTERRSALNEKNFITKLALRFLTPSEWHSEFDCVYVYNMHYSLLWLWCVCVILDGVNGGSQVMLLKWNLPLSVSSFLSAISLSTSPYELPTWVCVCEHKHVIAGPPRLCLSERLRTTTLRRWRERKTDKDRETHRGALKVTEDKTDKWRREREAQWRQGGGGEERHAGEKATLPPCKINLQNLNWTHISQWK